MAIVRTKSVLPQKTGSETVMFSHQKSAADSRILLVEFGMWFVMSLEVAEL